jgi:hypothetical protein
MPIEQQMPVSAARGATARGLEEEALARRRAE